MLTHFHDDHANGVPELLERLSVSAIALPDVEEDSPLRREILTLAEEKGIPLWWVRRDTTVELEKGQLTLYPPWERERPTSWGCPCWPAPADWTCWSPEI